MAKFAFAQAHVIEREGGYKLVDVEDDRGGRDVRRHLSACQWPDWAGWSIIDSDTVRMLTDALNRLSRSVLRRNGTGPTSKATTIDDQDAGDALYSCAVLARARTSVRLVQSALGATVDGIMGKRTLRRINGMGATLLLPVFTLLTV